MACNGATLGMADLHSSGNDTDVVFASPSRIAGPKLDEVDPPPQATEQHSRTLEEREVNDEEARDVALGKELAGIRNINQVIEGVIDGLERAGGNMDTVSRTVADATALLSTWTRILSQTEYNQRMILDPSWRGAGQDFTDMENESALKQQEKERRELEEVQRREARMRRLEEDERKMAESAGAKTPRGGRGRGRATSRAGVAGRVSSQASSTAPSKHAGVARAGSVIGRGSSSQRGRSRGT
ncbi:MAG: hypothetical protein LQ346_003162 [Caloplaca aetnensis]|nr:MAG: hypothetical protein LQ346_003162 [Caloplaca aetnensis]